jgi:hypothetical protein
MGGGAIGWSSKLQPIVALSSTEAEYMAATEAVKEVLWMRNILHEFGFPQHGASSLHIPTTRPLYVPTNADRRA